MNISRFLCWLGWHPLWVDYLIGYRTCIRCHRIDRKDIT